MLEKESTREGVATVGLLPVVFLDPLFGECSSLVSSNDDEGCIIHFIGLDVIMACVGGLLAWFVGRISKSPSVDPSQVSLGSMCLLVQVVLGWCVGHCCHLWAEEKKHSWIVMSEMHCWVKGSCCLY